VRALHQGHGVDIRESTGLERLTGEGRVDGAVLSAGERLDIDFAIIGIGISPDTGLAEAAGLTLENGIAVDGHCRSSDPAIYAAGDCASFPYQGTRIRLESVQNAIDQAEHAARVIMGSTDNYRPNPWFWSDQYDARLQIAGLNTGYDLTVIRPGHRPGGQSIWYYRGDTLLAVDAISDPKAYMQGKRWIEGGFSPDASAVANPDVDLKSLH
jgi:3-phenylpropionate/trans-cinnamate dioxygenase ferredoxin reductase subunit